MGFLVEMPDIMTGNGLLMYHWLPGVGTVDGVENGVAYPTLLDSLRNISGDASSSSNSDLRLQFLEDGMCLIVGRRPSGLSLWALNALDALDALTLFVFS